MKWYKPISCDNTVKNPLVCDYTNIEDYGFDEWSFFAGGKINNWNNDIIFQAKKKKNDGDPDDVLQNAEMLPIYSEKLIKELNKTEIEGIQYLSVNILKFDGKSIDGFSIVNFLNKIEALDYDKSDYNNFSVDFPNPNVRGKIAGVKKYVLKKNKLAGFDIVRLADYEQAFFVSEKFKELFERNKFTGYSFKEIELT
jgi:hypothetical protein